MAANQISTSKKPITAATSLYPLVIIITRTVPIETSVVLAKNTNKNEKIGNDNKDILPPKK